MERGVVERLVGVPDRGDAGLAYYSERKLWIWYRSSANAGGRLMKPADGDLVEKIQGQRLKIVGVDQYTDDSLLRQFGHPDPDWAYSFQTEFPYLVYRFDTFDLAMRMKESKVDWAILQDVWQESRRLSKE